MQLLPAENAGLLSHHLPSAVFSNDRNRVLAPLHPHRLTRVKIVARSAHDCLNSPLKLSIELGQGPYKQVLATSATDDQDYIEAGPGGIRTAPVDLRPEDGKLYGFWLVVERLSLRGGEEVVQVEVLSETRIEVGAWGVGSG
jgi:hypothetical protein